MFEEAKKDKRKEGRIHLTEEKTDKNGRDVLYSTG